MTHPMQMNCGHRDDSICIECASEYYRTHVIPLEEYKMMMGGCLDLIKETIEQLGEPMGNTPPMCYNDAIANLCSKRNREIWVLQNIIQKLKKDAGHSVDFMGDMVIAAQKELEEEINATRNTKPGVREP